MSVIQNLGALGIGDTRKDALAIVDAAYAAIDIAGVIEKKIHIQGDQLHIMDSTHHVSGRRVYFVGIGKCAIRAGHAIENLLGHALTGGILFDVSASDKKSLKMETYIGTHPLPSETNVQASERILESLAGRREDDLVIMLISGGGSSLLTLPEAPMTSADESALFETLTAQGAPIQDLNTVRKHTSRVRGGALAMAAYPARVISLIVSDVPGDNVETVASGPTVFDPSTVADAQRILKKYHVTPPERTIFLETTKDEKYFKHVTNILFLSSQDALAGMQSEALKRGYKVEMADTHFTGESRDVAHAIVEKLHGTGPRTAVLYAGESTVTLDTHEGKGGRNQEMALAALGTLSSDELVLPFASDGHDNTEHAGAIADEITRGHTDEKKLSIDESLKEHRSYEFFEKTGDALTTGPLESNVADLVVALKA
jgi:glycerate-2-kinase